MNRTLAPLCAVVVCAAGAAFFVRAQPARLPLPLLPEPAPPQPVAAAQPAAQESLDGTWELVSVIDDGKVKLRVTEATKTRAVTQVEVPGKVSNRKGVSLPDTTIPVSAMTPKDRADLDAALEAGIDWVAVSFVQRPEDVAEVRKVARGRALILSKIEKPQANASDGSTAVEGQATVRHTLLLEAIVDRVGSSNEHVKGVLKFLLLLKASHQLVPAWDGTQVVQLFSVMLFIKFKMKNSNIKMTI